MAIILLTWQLTINQPHCFQKVTDEAAAMSKERIETTKSPETLDRQIKQLTRLLATEKDRLVRSGSEHLTRMCIVIHRCGFVLIHWKSTNVSEAWRREYTAIAEQVVTYVCLYAVPLQLAYMCAQCGSELVCVCCWEPLFPLFPLSCLSLPSA